MDQTVLVDGLVEEAKKLVAQLDEQGVVPSVAAWTYFPDVNQWKLIIAGKTFDNLLPENQRDAFGLVSHAIQEAKLTSLNVGDVSLMKTEAELLKATSSLISTDPTAVMDIRSAGNILNGVYIPDMVIIRMSQ